LDSPIILKQNPWPTFLMVATGVFLSTMDSSMVNVALPSIMRSFGSSLPQTEWVVLMYLLTITVTLLFWGRLADQYGKSMVYLSGMMVFTLGSLACYFSVTLGQLVFFRFIQALGASMMMATGPAIIKMVFPVGQLGKALGFIGVATSVGLLLGPVISGILIHHFSWRGMFLVTVPVSFIAFLFGWFRLRIFHMEGKWRQDVPAIDWWGILLWAGLVSGFVLLSTLHADTDRYVIFCAVPLLLLLGTLFVKIELKQKMPIFPLSLFRKRFYSIAMFCASLSFAVLFVVLILMPFYLDYILGLSSQEIGFVMMAVPLSVFVVAPLSGILYDRIGARFLTTSGLALAAISLLLICFLTKDSSPMDVALRLVLLGCGQALFLSPNSADVLNSISSEQAGIASGMLATARNLGMLLGVTMAGMLFGFLFTHLSGGFYLKEFQPRMAGYFMEALKITFALTAVFSLCGAFLSGLRHPAAQRKTNTMVNSK
jgi:EmrB/QacA subfamily drug resistance transporter